MGCLTYSFCRQKLVHNELIVTFFEQTDKTQQLIDFHVQK